MWPGMDQTGSLQTLRLKLFMQRNRHSEESFGGCVQWPQQWGRWHPMWSFKPLGPAVSGSGSDVSAEGLWHDFGCGPGWCLASLLLYWVWLSSLLPSSVKSQYPFINHFSIEISERLILLLAKKRISMQGFSPSQDLFHTAGELARTTEIWGNTEGSAR